MIPSTSAHLIDRSEDVIFELLWVIKRSILSFPVDITKKQVTSVIDSAVLHWTMWLMVFPRNAGFGQCYLVSTRHEILSNIGRNLTGTRLRLRKKRNKIGFIWGEWNWPISRTPGKGTLGPELKSTKISGRARISAVLFCPTILDAFYGFKKVWFFHCSPPHTVSNQKI